MMFSRFKKFKKTPAVLSRIALLALTVMQLLPFQKKETYPFPENPLQGSRLFVSKGCIKCHMIWGIGDPLGPDLAQLSKGLNLLQLAGLLWSHSPKMIEIMQERGVQRPTFTPQEMGDLMSYIYYLNYFDQPGSFTTGEELFGEKGCERCHSIGDSGDKKMIPLDDYGRYISPVFLVTGLWNHSPDILAEMKSMGIKQPEFKGQELNHLLAYLRGEAVNQNGEVVYIEPGSPRKGMDLFTKKRCIVCHSVWGEGGEKSADLGRRELRLSLTEIAGKIWIHSGQMWQEMKNIGVRLTTFTPKEMADLISYLYFVQFYDEKGSPEEGKRLYREKACIFCHALEGEGENIGPDLSAGGVNLSPIYLASAMWNHAIVMKDMLQEKKLPWPRFSGNEMRDLVSYVQAAAKASQMKKMSKGPVPLKSKVPFPSINRFDLELAKQGEKIYTAKACNACHSINEKKTVRGGKR